MNAGEMSTSAFAWSLLVCWLAARPVEAPSARYEFTEVHMGVDFRLLFYAPDEKTAKVASRAAFDRIAALNGIMSDYDPQSELMRLCRTSGEGRAVPVSPELFDVLQCAQRLSEQTDGAFDVTVGPIVRLWRRARRRHELPPPERLAEARALVGYRNIRLDADAKTVELAKPGMRLDLGGIAKGYAADAALAVLGEHGVTSALVDGSGDIALGDAPPGTSGWRIAIAPLEAENSVGQAVPDADKELGSSAVGQAVPDNASHAVCRRQAQPDLHQHPRYLLLHNLAVATSGDLWQYVEIDGTRYSHLVDPKTGVGLTDHSSVTVIAPDCTTADSLASAVSVLGPKRGLELIEKTPGAAAYIERKPEGKVETYESSRFRLLPTTTRSD